jgi:heme exporter protein A
MKLIDGRSMNKIELADVACIRGGRLLFSGLSLQVGPSLKVLRLTGPNGCGKSSLLKIIAGLLPMAKGCVSFQGEPLKSEDIIFLDYKPILKPLLTVLENLKFWADLYGVSQANLELASESLGLVPLLHMPFNVLSSGQKKRAQLALLYLKPAKVWILDEPLLSLDHTYANRLGDIVKGYMCNGGIVVYASHDALQGFADITLDLTVYTGAQRNQDDFMDAA